MRARTYQEDLERFSPLIKDLHTMTYLLKEKCQKDLAVAAETAVLEDLQGEKKGSTWSLLVTRTP